MSAALALSWPGSRVLLGWWQQLLARHPQQLWFSHLLVHRVEALVRVTQARALDLWQRALLRVASTRVPCGGDLESALSDLQMDRQVLARLVGELTDAGLLHANGSGLWDLTATGRHALDTGALALVGEERRTFCFVDNAAVGRPPHFLSWRQPPQPIAPRPAPAVAEGSFDVAALEACIRQTPEWKARHHFPTDVEALLPPRSDEPPEANWRRVILDAPEQRALACIRTAGSAGEPVLLGFSVRADWTLEPEPALALGAGWEEVWPDLAEEPPAEAWRQAWQAWSQPRGLPPAEVDACRLERVDHRLLVRAPHRLIERLRAARSDAIKQESWILAGRGRTRCAAQVELQPL
jgi:hypothetical protein